MLKKCLRNRGLIFESRFLLGFFAFYILNGIEKVRGPTPLISTPPKSAFRPIKQGLRRVSRFSKPRAEKHEKRNAEQGGKCLKSAYTNRPLGGVLPKSRRVKIFFSARVMGQEYTTFAAPSPETARRTPQNALADFCRRFCVRPVGRARRANTAASRRCGARSPSVEPFPRPRR